MCSLDPQQFDRHLASAHEDAVWAAYCYGAVDRLEASDVVSWLKTHRTDQQ